MTFPFVAFQALVATSAFQPGPSVVQQRAPPQQRAPLLAIRLADEPPPGIFQPPTAADRALFAEASPSPVLQPREIISTMMSALHRSSWDDPRPYFGFEVALRFLSPTHMKAGVVPREFYRYLRQPHKQSLLQWAEYKWEGDTTIIDEEAYQQISVRSAPDGPWSSVRWMLVRVSPDERPHSQWMVDAVFVAEPDEGDAAGVALDEWEREGGAAPLPPGEALDLFAQFDTDGSGSISMDEFRDAVARLGIARSEDELKLAVSEVDIDRSGEIEFGEFEKMLSMVNERCSVGMLAKDITKSKKEKTQVLDSLTPSKVVETIMNALRNPDEPYPLHGAEVAIRYCSPTNRASQLSPQSFAQYLREPWYAILTEWDEFEMEEEEEEVRDCC